LKYLLKAPGNGGVQKNGTMENELELQKKKKWEMESRMEKGGGWSNEGRNPNILNSNKKD